MDMDYREQIVNEERTVGSLYLGNFEVVLKTWLGKGYLLFLVQSIL